MTETHSIGLAGRIQNAMDVWEFSADTAFNVSFVDLDLSAFACGGCGFIVRNPFFPIRLRTGDLDPLLTVLTPEE